MISGITLNGIKITFIYQNINGISLITIFQNKIFSLGKDLYLINDGLIKEYFSKIFFFVVVTF